MPAIEPAALVQAEHFRLMKCLEMRRVDPALAVGLAGRQDSQWCAVVSNVHQQRQRQVVAQDATIVEAMKLAGIDVKQRHARDKDVTRRLCGGYSRCRRLRV